MTIESRKRLTRAIAVLCALVLVRGDVPVFAQQTAAPAAAPAADTPTLLPADQLDSLVAPIALYPDPLLAQVLAASTYPLELVQLQQWLLKHKDLKDKALADAVQKETWDPSIQSMAGLPDVVKQMADNIQWTSELGNAFLAQQSDVMDAVQRMRTKAKDGGKLQSNQQIKVETKQVESQTVVVIEQSDPKVVYVPSYDPAVVWGAPPYYAYPPMVYPPGYYAAGAAISFGVGVAMGAMWSGGWGYNAGWGGGGHNNININTNNNFNRNSYRGGNNQIGGNNRIGNGNSWQHNPAHRGGAPYGDRATARQFGGNARGDSLGSRQANARQNGGGRLASTNNGIGGNRGAANGVGNRGSGGAGLSDARTRGGAGVGGDRGGSNGLGNRGSNAGGLGGGSIGGNRGAQAGGGGDRVGNRQLSGGGASSRGSGAFGGGSGAAARSSGSRGASSFGGSRGGGGGARGGGRRR